MAKVRVPKEHRPPHKGPIWDPIYEKWFKVAGKYRIARVGEYYWGTNSQWTLRAFISNTPGPRVLMQEVDKDGNPLEAR